MKHKGAVTVNKGCTLPPNICPVVHKSATSDTYCCTEAGCNINNDCTPATKPNSASGNSATRSLFYVGFLTLLLVKPF